MKTTLKTFCGDLTGPGVVWETGVCRGGGGGGVRDGAGGGGVVLLMAWGLLMMVLLAPLLFVEVTLRMGTCSSSTACRPGPGLYSEPGVVLVV